MAEQRENQAVENDIKELRDTKAGENSSDEESIISDQDESRGPEGSRRLKDDGFTGPAGSSISADELSDEFLAGEVDVREQMDRAAEALQDALEAELREGPRGDEDGANPPS